MCAVGAYCWNHGSEVAAQGCKAAAPPTKCSTVACDATMDAKREYCGANQAITTCNAEKCCALKKCVGKEKSPATVKCNCGTPDMVLECGGSDNVKKYCWNKSGQSKCTLAAEPGNLIFCVF